MFFALCPESLPIFFYSAFAVLAYFASVIRLFARGCTSRRREKFVLRFQSSQ
jgi:hypothetical protein